MSATFDEAFESTHHAFLAGRYAGQQERGELFRLLAAGVACKYERAGNAEMARAANEVCAIIFDLDLKMWPAKPRPPKDMSDAAIKEAEAG